MKRIVVVWCLVLGSLLAEAYQVHEEPEEEEADDETIRGKRQQNSAAVIDSIFNIPIAAIKQTSMAAQTWSPQNAGTIDNVLKIPVTTLEAVSNLIKNRYQQQQQQPQETTPLSRPSPRHPQRRYDLTPATSTTTSTSTAQPVPDTTKIDPLLAARRELIRKHVEAQREQQRLYQRELHRRRMELLLQHNRKMQQQIADDDERQQHKFYRNPFGFNALAKWIVGPQGVAFHGHTGHGDGHVYQYYDERKPLHFGIVAAAVTGRPNQDNRQPAPTKPTRPLSTSTTAASPTTSSDSSKTTTRLYAVREVVDEGSNPFTWPNWFGILDALGVRATVYPSTPTTIRTTSYKNNERPKVEQLLIIQPDTKNNNNKDVEEEEEVDQYYYKSKYAEARKKGVLQEEEITGNEIDGDVLAMPTRRLVVIAAN